MPRDPFEGLSGDELDPQAAETDQLAALGMHAVEGEDEDDLDDEDEDEDEDGDDALETADPSADLDKDGLQELEEMEQHLLEEEPILDFAMAEEE